MDPDTDIGGKQQRFPVTNQSAIAAARSEDQVVRQRAFDTILTTRDENNLRGLDRRLSHASQFRLPR